MGSDYCFDIAHNDPVGVVHEISVLDDFYGKDAKGDFLREVRQRACDLFDVTLGPDYNEAHKNHFHVDVGGDHACR
jgi:hypothetical protein